MEALHAAQRTVLLDADARLTEMLAAQRAEYEAAVSRHMAFVDRLLADKEALASRAEQLTDQIKVCAAGRVDPGG
jgi:5-azacytidine-induced protein 1